MTNTDQKTGKPVVAKPAKVASTPKPAVAAKAPARQVSAAQVSAPVAKAAAPQPVAAKPVAPKPAPAEPAVAKAPVAKPAAVEPPAAPKAAAPTPVAPKVEAPKAEAPKAETPKPVAAAPVAPTPVAPKAEPAAVVAPVVKTSPAPVAPVVEAAVAALADKPVSKPVVEAPVSSSASPKASTIPPIPFFMVPHMSTQTFKGYEDFAAFGKANLEAFVQANTLFAKGVEELSKEVVSLAQSSLETSTAATKAIFAAKTLKDVIELQADFAKTSFEKLVANSTKLGELTVKLATDSAAPIGARVTAASEKALKPAA
jgi:phasin family protein